jgi:hypothetical protein
MNDVRRSVRAPVAALCSSQKSANIGQYVRVFLCHVLIGGNPAAVKIAKSSSERRTSWHLARTGASSSLRAFSRLRWSLADVISRLAGASQLSLRNRKSPTEPILANPHPGPILAPTFCLPALRLSAAHDSVGPSTNRPAARTQLYHLSAPRCESTQVGVCNARV